ncbi:MAG: hypothetical protein V1808_04730 [Candidatus Daviesbacteria bacterium]
MEDSEGKEIANLVDNYLRQKVSRRKFLRKTGELAATTAMSLAAGTTPHFQKQTPAPVDQIEGFGRAEAEKLDTELTDHELQGKILNTPLGSPERETLEEIYVSRAETWEQVNQGFWVITDMDFRCKLLDKRYEIRQQGKEATPLTTKQEQDAFKLGIHPEVYATCLDAQGKVLEIAQKLMPKRSENEIKLMMPNLGEMCALIRTETGMKNLKGKFNDRYYGFVNIGSKPALFQIKLNPNLNVDLKFKELINTFRKISNLEVKAENIPGSSFTETALSGGAVGPCQLMPHIALNIYEKVLDGSGESLNFLDLKDAVIMAWIHTIDPDNIWNNDQNQIAQIKAGGQLYENLTQQTKSSK